MAIGTTAALLIGAAATAGAGAVAANSAAKKAAGAAGSGRDLATEAENTLETQLRLAPQQYEAYAKYAPLYQQTDQNLLKQQLYGTTSFDSSGYLASKPDLQQNWNADPGYAQAYGTLENYAKADYLNNSNDPRFMKAGGGLYDLLPDMTAKLGAANAGANTLQRQADIGDVATLGDQAYGLFQKYNPALFAAQGKMAALADTPAARVNLGQVGYDTSSVRDVTAATPTAATVGRGMLGGELQRQAMDGLRQGGQISGQEARAIEQRTLALANRQGNAHGNSAFANTVLNLDSAQQQRLAQRQQFAQGVYGTDLSRSLANAQATNSMADANAGRQLAAANANQAKDLNLLQTGIDAGFRNAGLRLTEAQANDQFLGNALGRQAQALGAAGAVAYDPFQGVLGRSSVNQGTNAALLGQAAAGTSGGTATRGLFDPFNSYASDLYNTNYNAQVASQLNAANARAGMSAGLFGLAGNLLGGAFGGG